MRYQGKVLGRRREDSGSKSFLGRSCREQVLVIKDEVGGLVEGFGGEAQE